MSTTTETRGRTAPTPSAWQLSQAKPVLLRLREQLIAADPEIAEDPKLLADMLEGEDPGDTFAAIERVLTSALDDEAMAFAAKLRKDDLAARQKRYEDRAETKRRGVQDLLEAIGVRKFERPGFTASLIDRPGSIDVPDPAKLPHAFQRITIAADKTLIAAAFKAGQKVKGATRGNGGCSLTVRVR